MLSTSTSSIDAVHHPSYDASHYPPQQHHQRLAIFIDGSNLYNGMRDNLESTRVNLQALVAQISQNRRVVRTYYYNAPLTTDYQNELREGQQRFFESINRIPYVTLRLGRLYRRNDGTLVEKGIDVALTVECLTLAYENAYDNALIISGDGDYVELVEALKRKGKHVEVAMFRSQSAGILLEHADVFLPLDDLDWNDIVF